MPGALDICAARVSVSVGTRRRMKGGYEPRRGHEVGAEVRHARRPCARGRPSGGRPMGPVPGGEGSVLAMFLVLADVPFLQVDPVGANSWAQLVVPCHIPVERAMGW